MEFRILGPIEVHCDGQPLPIGAGRQRALLAVLLVHANQTVSRDRLVNHVWGERSPPTAVKALQGHVSALRRVLGADTIVTRGSGYELRVGAGQLDRARFEDLRERGLRALVDGRADEATGAFREALGLWRGAPLDDVAYESFAQAEIARLEELRAVTLEDRVDADLACGRSGELIGELEAMVAEHPLRERLRGQLMLALYRAGRQADALAVYRDARTTLVETLGLDPGRELQELEAAILRQDGLLDAPAPSHTAPVAQPAAALPSVLARAAERPFIGRVAELDRLRDAWASARSGAGRLVAISGEPGIGKTTLIARVAREADEQGGLVLLGRCHPEALVPYEPFVELLRQLPAAALDEHAGVLARVVPGLGDSDPAASTTGDASARHLLFDAVAHTLAGAAAAGPLVVVLEDLHWAEPATLLLTRHVARVAEQASMMIVLTYRTTEAHGTGQVVRALSDLEREVETDRVGLAGFGDDDVAAMVGALGGAPAGHPLGAALRSDTAGNPLFVTQLVRHLEERGALVERDGGLELAAGERRLGVPETAKDLVEARLAALGDRTAGVLRVAAVIGPTFSGELLATLAGDDALDALDAGVLAGLLEDDGGGRWAFVHAVVHDAIYDGIGGGRRARLHGQIAETLGVLADPAELAHHFLAAGDRTAGLRYSLASAERALEQLAFEDAAARYRNALEALGRSDEVQRCELLLALGDTLARAGDSEGARSTYREAAALAETLGLPRQLAQATIGYGGRVVWDVSRDDPGLVPLLEHALEALGEADDSLRVRLLARLGGGPLRGLAEHDRREALTSEGLAIARRLDDPPTLAYALSGYIAAHHSPDYTVGQVNDATEMIEIAQTAGDLERVVEGYEHRACMYIQLGNPAAADADIEASAQAASALRQPAQDWMLAYMRANRALLDGHLAAAEQIMRDGVAAARAAQLPFTTRVIHGVQIVVLRRLQGRLPEVEQEARALAEEYGPTYALSRCAHLLVLAELGRTDAAHEALEALSPREFGALHRDETWMGTIALLSEATAILGRADHAETLYAQLEPYADRVAISTPEISVGAVERYLGLLARACGRHERATEHLGAAADFNERIGARPWFALALYDRATLEADADLGARAAAEFTALGMESWAAKCSST